MAGITQSASRYEPDNTVAIDILDSPWEVELRLTPLSQFLEEPEE